MHILLPQSFRLSHNMSLNALLSSKKNNKYAYYLKTGIKVVTSVCFWSNTSETPARHMYFIL